MTRDQVVQTVISSLISCFFSMFLFYYLRRYFDKKSEAEEMKKKELEKQRKRKMMAEADWRQKVGRYLFWIYQGMKKPPPNGELEAAKGDFEDAEAELKKIDQEMIADVCIKNN